MTTSPTPSREANERGLLERILRFAIDHRWLVMLGTRIVAAIGVYNLQRLPVDAVPDITNVQVQINTEAHGYSPLEVEQLITFPVETAMAGLPSLSYTRSLSRYALSQVTVVFEDGTDIYFARQLVAERIQEVKGELPNNIEPSMGPIATGLGEIYMYTVHASPDALNEHGRPYDASDLRTVQDWIIRPQLRTVRGVTEVNSIGGFIKQYQVAPDPAKLVAYGLGLPDLVTALERNNSNVGAGYIERNGEQYLVRTPGRVTSIDDIRSIVVSHEGGVPVYVRDIADVEFGRELRNGAATQNGGEVVLGTVFMLVGENSRAVSRRVDRKIRDIQSTLPAGVSVSTVYDRTTLVNATIETVRHNLTLGAVLVVLVLFLLLGNFRACCGGAPYQWADNRAKQPFDGRGVAFLPAHSSPIATLSSCRDLVSDASGYP